MKEKYKPNGRMIIEEGGFSASREVQGKPPSGGSGVPQPSVATPGNSSGQSSTNAESNGNPKK